ncbi:hypothetical protein IWW52_002822, partial [Coemansia sp. RSA 2704]
MAAHEMLGHVSEKYVREFAKSHGMTLSGKFTDDCRMCVQAKVTSPLHMGSITSSADSVLAVVHSDVAMMPIGDWKG